MLSPQDSTEEQLSTIKELKARLAAGRTQRSNSLHQLQECAEKAAEDTPACTPLYGTPTVPRNGNAPNGQGSGVFSLPKAEQVEERKKQLIEERKKSRVVLDKLKATSFLVVQKMSPTQYLDPAELLRRLGEDGLGSPAESAPSLTNGNGAASA